MTREGPSAAIDHSSDPAMAQAPRLEMRGITKRFPGVLALDNVDLVLQPGEMHGVVGENGAGKSTLIKILSGVYPSGDFSGEIRIDGRLRRFANVHQAHAAGIMTVYQELSLVQELSVAENIFLGREPRRWGIVGRDELVANATRILADLQLPIDPQMPVGELGIARQQLVEIGKALSRDSRILVLDEPTAALSDTDAAVLWSILDRLRKRGIAVIYISHRLNEIFRLADRITVLRDGRVVTTAPASSLDESQVVSLMVGRDVAGLFPPRDRDPGSVALEVRDLTVVDPDTGKTFVDHVSFAVRRGEVLGIAGLMGAGRTELLTAIFGAHSGRVTGEVLVGGRRAVIERPSDAIGYGIGLITEDRKRYGLVLEQTVLANMTLTALRSLAHGPITDVHRETTAADRLTRELRIKAPSLFTRVATLSGGNQQKVVLGKWLLAGLQVLLLDEPTRGIDVGAKQEIYFHIDRLARAGLAVVLVSSELPEVAGLSDRVVVLRQGRLIEELSGDRLTLHRVVACAAGDLTHTALQPSQRLH